jgi:hypothetical protein
MAGVLEFRWAFTFATGGIQDGAGSLVLPVKAVTTTLGFQWQGPRTLTKRSSAPMGTPVKLWGYEDGFYFDLLVFQVRGGSGVFELAWLKDKPTSSTDLTPAGAGYRSTGSCRVSCHAPFVLNTAVAAVHPTLATAAGIDGDGIPAILTSASTEDGRIYGVWASNLSDTDDLIVDVWGVA